MALPNVKTFTNFMAEISMEVLGKVGGTLASSTDRPSIDQLKQLFNDAYMEVCGEHDWAWLYTENTFSTAIGQTSPYTPAIANKGLFEVLWMSIESLQQAITPLTNEQYRALHPGGYTNIGNGTPSFYVQTYNASDNAISFLLGPCPAAEVWTVKYGAKLIPQALVDTTDVMVIPAPWQDLVKLRCLIKVYRILGPGAKERLDEAKTQYSHLFSRAWVDDQSQGSVVRARRDALAQLAGYMPSLNQVLFNG